MHGCTTYCTMPHTATLMANTAMLHVCSKYTVLALSFYALCRGMYHVCCSVGFDVGGGGGGEGGGGRGRERERGGGQTNNEKVRKKGHLFHLFLSRRGTKQRVSIHSTDFEQGGYPVNDLQQRFIFSILHL